MSKSQYEDKSAHPKSAEFHNEAYVEGCTLYGEHGFAQARRSFETALEYKPDDPQAWFALGNCHDAMRSPAKAEVCYRMALKFSEPDAFSTVYYNLGNSLLDQQKYAEAIEFYTKVSSASTAFQAACKNAALARGQLK